MNPMIDPDLYPDLAHLGFGLLEAIIYVRVERVQRYPALGDGLRPAHLDTTQAPAALYPGALSPTAHRARERPLHRPPERRPTFELLGNRLRHERSVELGTR